MGIIGDNLAVLNQIAATMSSENQQVAPAEQPEDNATRPRVSQKQIMSHHFGFGNIQVDKVGTNSIRNKATGLEASGKYQEKLMRK